MKKFLRMVEILRGNLGHITRTDKLVKPSDFSASSGDSEGQLCFSEFVDNQGICVISQSGRDLRWPSLQKRFFGLKN